MIPTSIYPVIIAIVVYPMMSLALRFAIANNGIAQNGCIILVSWSPSISIITAVFGDIPSSLVVSSSIGPCATHCPPPDGIKMFTIPVIRIPMNGHVSGVAKLAVNSFITVVRPVPC